MFLKRSENRERKHGESMKLTLDSSTIVASLRKSEEFYEHCDKLMTSVLSGVNIAFKPYTVLVEIVAALKRRTGSIELAENAKNILLASETIHFFDLSSVRAVEASDIANNIGVRGMDAIVIQIAKENDSILVTLDDEMVKKQLKSFHLKV